MAGTSLSKAGLFLAAGVVGASGLGLEVLSVSLSGLPLGYGVSSVVGLTTFLVGWALGAGLSGRYRGSPRQLLFGGGLAVAWAGYLTPRAILWAGSGEVSAPLAVGVTIIALLGLAVPQGLFLPQLARLLPPGGRADLGGLIGANLLGAGAGAWLLGETLPAAAGRLAAGSCAGALGLVAAGLAVAASGGARQALDTSAGEAHLGASRAGLLVALTTGWAGTLEGLGLRQGVLWLGGMEEALGSVLVASLVALALGAWILPRLLGDAEGALARLGFLCALAGLGFFLAPWLLPRLGGGPPVLLALGLVLLSLAPFGAVVPILHRDLAGSSGARLGGLFTWEALGAALGLPLAHLVLLPHLGWNGTLAVWSASGALLWAVLQPGGPRARIAVAAAGASAGLLIASRPPLAWSSPPLANPALERLAFEEDEHFAVSVVEDGVLGERTVMTDGFRAAGTGPDYAYMRALGHLPLLLHPAPKSVAVLAFGTGTTAGAVALHPEVESLDVLELSEAVTDQARWFEAVHHGVLDDPRTRLRLGDGRRTLAAAGGRYDVVTMEPLLPDSPFGVYLYTEAFYRQAASALAEGGLLCQWVPPHALEPEVFEAVLAAFTEALPWSAVFVFGTQVVLLGGERAPLLRAARFPAEESALMTALRALGLESPGALAARFVLAGEALEPPLRRLTDEDPWIIYRPRRSGVVLLLDLPTNLRFLRERATQPPLEWRVGLPGAAQARIEAHALLRAAREAQAVEELEARGVSMPDPGWSRDAERLFARARELAPEDAEVLAALEEREFLGALRGGVALLAPARGVEGARLALPLLARAAELRPLRGDVAWYHAIALRRLELPGAADERARALELCPRIQETPAGRRTRGW